MSNRSLIFFIIFSIAAHLAVAGLWPNTEQISPQRQKSSIEVGMLSIPRIDRDFTRDLSRLQHIAQMIHNQRSGQRPITATVKVPPTDNGRRIDMQTFRQINNKISTKEILNTIEENVSLTTVPASTPKHNKSPVKASKAAPLYAINPAPVYPANALRYGWEGEVWLTVIVNRSGSVGKIVVEQSSDYKILDQAAINTVRDWQFEPARIGDKTTEGAVSIPIHFRINRS